MTSGVVLAKARTHTARSTDLAVVAVPSDKSSPNYSLG